MTILLQVAAGRVAGRLMAADGAVLDQIACSPRTEPYDLALLADCGGRPDKVVVAQLAEGSQARRMRSFASLRPLRGDCIAPTWRMAAVSSTPPTGA